MAQMLAPVRLSDYNVADLEYRAFSQLARTNRTLGSITSPLQTRGNLSAGRVDNIIDRRVEAQRRLWQDVNDTVKAFENLGRKPRKLVEQQAINGGLSRRRIEQIRSGFVDTPILSDDVIRNMLKFGGPERVQNYYRAIGKHGKVIQLE
jgi:hypothetical protein